MNMDTIQFGVNNNSETNHESNLLFWMTSSGKTIASDSGIQLIAVVREGVLEVGREIEIFNLATNEAFTTCVKQIQESGIAIDRADKNSREVHVLTEFFFVPFTEDSELVGYYVGDKGRALAAYEEMSHTVSEDHVAPFVSGAKSMQAHEDDVPLEESVQSGKVCPKCSTVNSQHDRFCISCGQSLDAKASSSKPSYLIPIIIGVIVFLAVIGVVAWIIFGKGDSSGSIGISSDAKVITALDERDIDVLDSDWDWDSSFYDSSNDMYKVDAILFVKNNSESAITAIDFEVESKNGHEIHNAKDSEEPLSAEGYIAPGEKGIMVGEIWTNKKKIRPQNGTYDITAAYTNHAIQDYTVPYGRVLYKYGPDNDFYDITIDNPNSVEVNQSAVIVAVKIRNNEIQDADATGRLNASIQPETYDFFQEKAFNDPNIFAEADDLTVYALDTEFYHNYR